MSEIDKKEIATTSSGHGAVGTPAVNNNPPTPPAGPVPVPYVYVSASASAKQTDAAVEVGGARVLVKGSTMKVEMPGDAPAKPTGGDFVTLVTVGLSEMMSGSGTSIADGRPICVTNDMLVMNLPAAENTISQVNTPLLGAPAFAAAAGAKVTAALAKKYKNTALPPNQANKPGGASSPAAPTAAGDPVDVATGAVVDHAIDLALPGAMPFRWVRNYSTLRSQLQGALGRGGWVHSFEQWVTTEEACISLRSDDGRDIWFALVPPGEVAFHRRERLELSADRQGGFQVCSIPTRLTRRFAPLEPGGRAVLRRMEDAWGNAIELDYDGDRLTRIRDTAGRAIMLRNDKHGRVERVEIWAAGELQRWVDLAYHPEGELARVTDALGFAQSYTYDGHHRLLENTLKNGSRFWHRYDPENGWCTRTWGDGGLLTVELHPDFRKRTTLIGASEEPLVYTWNDQRIVIKHATHDGNLVREKTFDDDLYLLAEVNAAGETLRIEYDSRGNRTKAIDAAGNTTRWEFSGDRPTRRIAPGGHTTTYAHDAQGQLVSITYPSGDAYSLTYDERGRVTSVHGRDGQLFGYTHDNQHNLLTETDARGARTTYTYDALGSPVTRTDASGDVTRVHYDRRGQRTEITHPDGSRARTTHDAMGAVSCMIDASGRETRLERGVTGALERLVLTDGHAFRFDYDTSERLRKITNPRFEEYEFGYDRAGRVIREKTFDGRELRYTYNKAERLSRIDYPDETYRVFQYDPLGNVVAEQSPHGGITYTRSELGWLIEVVLDEYNGNVVNRFEHDALGRVLVEHQGERMVRVELDERGRRVTRLIDERATTRYRHDVTGATSYVEHDGHRITFERDPLGRATTRHMGRGGVTIAASYDSMDRLLEQSVSVPSPAGDGTRAMLVERRFAYDVLGRLRQIDDARAGTSTYEYDWIGQLIEARHDGLHEVFEYDPAGSLQNALTDLDQVGRIKPWEIETGNLLTEAGGTRYENDKRGRRVKKIAPGSDGQQEETRYLWDCRDRLREVRLPSGDRVLFKYDAFARRVRKEVVPAGRLEPARLVAAALRIAGAEADLPARRVVDFVWDGDMLAADIENGRERVFVCEPASPIPMLQAEGGEVFTVVNDHLGMPKELLDSGGRLAWSADHSAWGRVTGTRRDPAAAGAIGIESPFRLLGQYEDRETGLCFTRFRYFDAERGRWCSPDPLGFRGGRNLLSFDGSPQCDVDPLGLSALRNKSTPTMYYVEDPEAGGKLYVSMAVEEGVFGGVFRLRKSVTDEDGNVTGELRSKLLRGNEQFDAAVKHLDGQFDKIKGQWDAASGLTDNLDELNRLTRGMPDNNESIIKAAPHVWTGDRADANGFRKPQVIAKDGTSGKFTRVVVYFGK